MLAVKTYTQTYIDECRAQLDAQLAAYRAVVVAAGTDQAVRSALESFEPLFFNNLTFVLDGYFVHRTRAVEGKDGNALNEVRMLTDSILHNHGVLGADKTIKYAPETSVLKHAIGDTIRLDETQFVRLSAAYFAEIERRFTES